MASPEKRRGEETWGGRVGSPTREVPHLTTFVLRCSSAGGRVCGRLKGVEGKESRSGRGKTVGLKFLFLHTLKS